jgi:outer membrane biosynthesis protein TonB
MKKIIATIIIAIGMFSANALAPSDVTVNQKIKTEITYPDFARHNLETGFVAVNFMIDTLGLVTVKQVNTDNPVLRDYVVRKMQSMTFEECKGDTCQDFYIRIDFQLK